MVIPVEQQIDDLGLQWVRLPFKIGLWHHLDWPSADQMVESLTEYPVHDNTSMKAKFY